MAGAIAPAIGLGTSLIGGISGKGAAKKQQKLAEQQYQMLKPLIEAQIKGSQYALGEAQNLYGLSRPQIMGAEGAIRDLQNFWRPTMSGDRSAIDRFFAPERRAINQGYRTAAENIAKFAPRGGGRISALARGDIQRQGQLADTIFAGRREGANQSKDLAGMLSQLGLGTGGLATGTLGAGLSGGSQAYGLYNSQANRAYDSQFGGGGNLFGPGNQIGKYLVDLFKGKFGGGNKSSGSGSDSWDL